MTKKEPLMFFLRTGLEALAGCLSSIGFGASLQNIVDFVRFAKTA